MRNQRQNITAMIFDRKGRLLSVGKNSYVKTHPLQAATAKKMNLPDKIFLHAEVDAIVRLEDRDKAYRILITRVSPDGTFRLVKPCTICAEVISKTTIKIVEHT